MAVEKKATKKQSAKRADRDDRGRFLKGVSPNPKGRPKGSINHFSIAELRRAIKAVERRKQKDFMEAWIEAAWGDAKAMSNIANYMLPKLRAIEGLVNLVDSSMDDALAETIRNKLRERFND